MNRFLYHVTYNNILRLLAHQPWMLNDLDEFPTIML